MTIFSKLLFSILLIRRSTCARICTIICFLSYLTKTPNYRANQVCRLFCYFEHLQLTSHLGIFLRKEFLSVGIFHHIAMFRPKSLGHTLDFHRFRNRLSSCSIGKSCRRAVKKKYIEQRGHI